MNDYNQAGLEYDLNTGFESRSYAARCLREFCLFGNAKSCSMVPNTTGHESNIF